MRPVARSEILDYATYGDGRDAERARIMEVKAERRIHVAGVLTFLFENHATVRYQVQEMILAERMVKEADIAHELATYNELLGRDGGLGCTLLIEIEDPATRDRKLREWVDLCPHLYARFPGGERIYAEFDPAQVDADRLSSVQFLHFAVCGQIPAAIGCDHRAFKAETELSPAQRAALAEDLGDA